MTEDAELLDLVEEITRRAVANHIINHPEIGAVLDARHGAQSVGCAYDTEAWARENAPEWLERVLLQNEQYWTEGRAGFLSAVLASDGWWWKSV